MALEPITDHFGQAITALIPPFWGKPIIASLLWSYVKQIQRLEDDAWEVLGAFDVRTCDATRLAILGKIVGQPNFGWSLETYRAVVKAKIATNRSKGREDDILRVLRLITSTTADINITTRSPATLVVVMTEPITQNHLEAIAFLLPKTRAAGVGLNFTAPLEGGFTFDSSVSPLAGAGTLDSSVSPLVGAGVIGMALRF
jgi:hypothetical protein